MGEGYALLDVALEAFHSGLEEDLLIVIKAGEWVLCLLGTSCLSRR